MKIQITNDCISRQKALLELERTMDLNMLRKRLATMQAERPEPRKAVWLEVEGNTQINGMCSRCGLESIKGYIDVYGLPYCPGCGSEMEMGGDEHD